MGARSSGVSKISALWFLDLLASESEKNLDEQHLSHAGIVPHIYTTKIKEILNAIAPI